MVAHATLLVDGRPSISSTQPATSSPVVGGANRICSVAKSSSFAPGRTGDSVVLTRSIGPMSSGPNTAPNVDANTTRLIASLRCSGRWRSAAASGG